LTSQHSNLRLKFDCSEHQKQTKQQKKRKENKEGGLSIRFALPAPQQRHLSTGQIFPSLSLTRSLSLSRADYRSALQLLSLSFDF